MSDLTATQTAPSLPGTSAPYQPRDPVLVQSGGQVQPRLIRNPHYTPPTAPTGPLAGYVAWYDATQITGLADGAQVATWPDASGNGHDMTLAAFFPLYYKTTTARMINGHPSVWFESANHRSLETNSLSVAVPYTVITVVQTQPSFATIFSSNSGQPALATYNTDFQIVYSPGNIYYPGPIGIAGHMVAGVFNTGVANSGYAYDGSSSVSQNFASNPIASFSFLGVLAGSGTNYLDGSIGEVLIYPRALTSDELATTHAYVSAKWGTP